MEAMESGPVAYFEGHYCPIEDAKISVMTHAFNYGTGLFEGIRGYHVPEENNIFIFKLYEHVERLFRNFSILYMDIPETREDIENICIEIVKKSGFKQDVYIRPICYKSEYLLVPKLSGIESKLCCYVITLGDYVDIKEGLNVAVSSWRRSADNAMPARAKTTGGYINSSLAATDAKDADFDEAIFLGEDGTVSEGSAMNIFMVLDGKLITPPPTANILVGITRDTIIKLAIENFDLEVEQRHVGRTELYAADELFFTGTGAQVAPVRSVDRRNIGNGKPGPITLKLQKLYFDVVQGKVEQYRHWCTPVY